MLIVPLLISYVHGLASGLLGCLHFVAAALHIDLCRIIAVSRVAAGLSQSSAGLTFKLLAPSPIL